MYAILAFTKAAQLLILCLDNVLDNDQLQVDFKPLYECIHIYSALDSLDEIRRSYQADRKVCPIRRSACLEILKGRVARRNLT